MRRMVFVTVASTLVVSLSAAGAFAASSPEAAPRAADLPSIVTTLPMTPTPARVPAEPTATVPATPGTTATHSEPNKPTAPKAPIAGVSGSNHSNDDSHADDGSDEDHEVVIGDLHESDDHESEESNDD